MDHAQLPVYIQRLSYDRPGKVSSADDKESEDSEAEDLLLNGGDIENDSDADLDALLEDANRLVGRPYTSNKRAKTGKGQHMTRGVLPSDDDEEDEGQDIMYGDFWGSSEAKQGRAVGNSRKKGDYTAVHFALCLLSRMPNLDCVLLCMTLGAPDRAHLQTDSVTQFYLPPLQSW